MKGNTLRGGTYTAPCYPATIEMDMFDSLPAIVRRALAYADHSYAPSRVACLMDKGRSADEIVAMIARNDALRLKPLGK